MIGTEQAAWSDAFGAGRRCRGAGLYAWTDRGRFRFAEGPRSWNRTVERRRGPMGSRMRFGGKMPRAHDAAKGLRGDGSPNQRGASRRGVTGGCWRAWPRRAASRHPRPRTWRAWTASARARSSRTRRVSKSDPEAKIAKMKGTTHLAWRGFTTVQRAGYSPRVEADGSPRKVLRAGTATGRPAGQSPTGPGCSAWPRKRFKLRAEIVERAGAQPRAAACPDMAAARTCTSDTCSMSPATSLLMRKLIGAGTPREAVAGGYGDSVLVLRWSSSYGVALCFAVE